MKQLIVANSVKYVIVDDKDFEKLLKYKWFTNNGDTHIYRTLFGGNYRKKTRSIANDIFNTIGVKYDHKDRNPYNCIKENLRLSTSSLNGANREGWGKVGYKGVTKSHRKYMARITINYKVRHLGGFKTPEEAARIYDSKAKELFGEHAVLNFNESKDSDTVNQLVIG